MSKNDGNKKSSLLKGLNSVYKAAVYPVFAIFVALLIAVFFVMWAVGQGFIDAAATLFGSIWQGSFGSTFSITETFVFVTPLLFTGLANAIALRTGLLNIGAEGQFTVGMLAAAIIGLIPGIPGIIHIILVLLAGMLAGAIWAGIPGYLKAKTGANEVVNTIMMNYIAMYLINYVVMGPLNVKGTATSITIQPSAMLWQFAGSSYRVNTGLFIGIVFVILTYILLWKTTHGYELRAVGLSPYAAEYGGISIKKNIILAMVISGSMAGIGGAVHVAGIQHKAIELFQFTNFGFDGMAVALLAKSNPIGVLFAAVLFGALNSSSLNLQLNGVPKEIVLLIQGIIIIFVAADYIYKWYQEKRRKGAMINE